MSYPTLSCVRCSLGLWLTLSCALTGCGDERRPATEAEKETATGVLSTGLHLRDSSTSSRIELPPGTATLLDLVVDSACVASLTTEKVGDHVKETLTYNCKDGDFRGQYSRELDHFTFDLSARTAFDIRYTADVTARRDFIDGWLELKSTKDLWVTDVGVTDRINFLGIQRDANGCMVGGGMQVELHANLPGKKIDVSMDATFGPGCGEVWVRK